MPLSMFQASAPVFIRVMNNLKGVLEKGAAHAAASKIDQTVLLNSRLFPDMFPLVRQVQIASDNAKGGGARLAGMTPPKYEDAEASFPELNARIEKTVGFLQTLTPAQIDGSDEKTINLTLGKKTLTFQGQAYLFGLVLPNLYFHVTTAYAILRHCGVPLGKEDFLGKG